MFDNDDTVQQPEHLLHQSIAAFPQCSMFAAAFSKPVLLLHYHCPLLIALLSLVNIL
jgi:hypothetical protein